MQCLGSGGLKRRNSFIKNNVFFYLIIGFQLSYDSFINKNLKAYGFSGYVLEEYEPEGEPALNVDRKKPKIGVFVCHCGTNIAGFVDVKKL